MRGHLRGCESFNLGDLTGVQHARPHGEEARAARRLEPWRQVRTRGHPSRRPRFARAPQDEVGVVKDSEALRMTVIGWLSVAAVNHDGRTSAMSRLAAHSCR